MRFGVGQPVPRTEDPRLLTGNGRYADDFLLPAQSYAYVIRSPHAHARIAAIDVSPARTLPGVLCVLTGADYEADGLGPIVGPSPRKRRDGQPMYRPPRPALTRDAARYLGQPVAVVVAETALGARDAAEQVEIEYEPLPVNVETGHANDPSTPRLWPECESNESFLYEVGDAAATARAFAAAAHVVSQRFVINRITANPMEPRSVNAHYHKGEDRYTIYAGSQRPYAWRATLARNTFKIDEHQLSFITGDVGGSFGMKGSIHPEIPLMAWASKRVGRPVKWTSDRSEGFIADDHARDNVSEAELALDEHGRFLAVRVRTQANLGAYVAFLGAGPPTGNVGTMAGVYTTPAMHVQVAGVLTNTNPLSPYRGAGRPEAAYVMERLVDIAARRLHIDPAELRRRNLIPNDAFPYKTALTFTYDCGEFDKLFDKCLKAADYAGFESRREAAATRGLLRGIGISFSIEIAANPQTETAEIRFNSSGTATVLVGTTPHGQGHETIYKQLVCERLGLTPEQVRVVEGDTDQVSFGTGTGGSRVASLGSAAVLMGIEKCVAKGRRIAAQLLEAAESDIDFEDAEYRIAGTDRRLGFREVAQAAFSPDRLSAGMEPGMYEIATYNPSAANFPNGCQICEVEIDPETGRTRIVALNAVDDVGFEINPLLVKGQIHGGIAQGAGQALMENLVYDEAGQLLSGSFMDYAMPRADDFCEMQVASHPVPTRSNPLGTKGAGESGTVGALAAVMNAINDALAPLGIEHLEMPATPERVWRAIRAARTGAQ
ncbi:MAG: xanthine dehydrogenase family protein molybdopterin-binding subunit [Gammaproteobacteria bacterium]|nr:xanthine dehydrogenase family protein molybdopterin-binding subunit [Gammaproteobacteria bacterium]